MLPSGRVIFSLSTPSKACFKNSIIRPASDVTKYGVTAPQFSGM